jgi:hypothetical protein
MKSIAELIMSAEFMQAVEAYQASHDLATLSARLEQLLGGIPLAAELGESIL